MGQAKLAAAGTYLEESRCPEEDCMAQFVFCVIHTKAREEGRLFLVELGESLVIVKSKSFPIKTTMHPS